MCIKWNIYVKCRIYLNPSIFKSFNHFQTAIELVHQSRNKKTKKLFYLQNWQWWQNTLELPPLYLTISSQKLSTFSAIFALHQIRNPTPCLCAGNLYGLHVFGECFCVKATCCKCDFFSRKPWHIIYLKRSKRWQRNHVWFIWSKKDCKAFRNIIQCVFLVSVLILSKGDNVRQVYLLSISQFESNWF